MYGTLRTTRAAVLPTTAIVAAEGGLTVDILPPPSGNVDVRVYREVD
jgi:hypothetical protein